VYSRHRRYPSRRGCSPRGTAGSSAAGMGGRITGCLGICPTGHQPREGTPCRRLNLAACSVETPTSRPNYGSFSSGIALWSRPDMAGTVDVIVVDEAGQFSVANALAVAQNAHSVVLRGAPAAGPAEPGRAPRRRRRRRRRKAAGPRTLHRLHSSAGGWWCSRSDCSVTLGNHCRRTPEAGPSCPLRMPWRCRGWRGHWVPSAWYGSSVGVTLRDGGFAGPARRGRT
jgi:hypothetical protein